MVVYTPQTEDVHMTQRLRSMSRKWKALSAVAAVAVLSVVPIQMAAVQAADPPPPVPFEAGNLKLSMKAGAGNSHFQFIDNTGVVETDTFSASAKCGYVNTVSSLMLPSASIVPTNVNGTVVGFQQKDNGYGLGVNRAGKEGSGSCSQTNASERLVLELKNDVQGSNVEDMFIDKAELDVEYKYNSVLEVEFFLGTDSLGSESYPCDQVSDCGPDSADGDNKRVELTAPTSTTNPYGLFDKMAFTVTSSGTQAAATIEGGSDANTSASNFHLVSLLDPALCGEPIFGTSDAFNIDDTNVEITLVDTTGCSTKGYALDVTEREIEFITAGGTTDQWVVEVNDWAPEPAVNPIPASVVYPPDGGEDVVWCDGMFDPDDTPSTGGTYGGSMPTSGDHSWCLIRQDAEIAGQIATDTGPIQAMQVNEILLLEADARITRG